jgi:hypothetical protein
MKGETMAETTQQAAESPKYLYGLFEDREQAEAAYQFLVDRGYAYHSVGVVMAEETRNKFYPQEPRRDASSETPAGGDNKSKQGLGVMSAAGAALGALVAVGTVVALPGAIVVGGALAAGLAGAGLGGVAGGLFGGLLGSAVPKDESDFYENRVQEGKILVRVVPESQEEFAEITKEWERLGGEIKRE